MTRPPEFDSLVGKDVRGEERHRLRQTHDLLVAAGPLPELPPSLAEPPGSPSAGENEVTFALPRRRIGASLALAAALAFASFGAGYYLADRGDENQAAFRAQRLVQFRATAANASAAVAVVQFGARDRSGNWPMLVTVEGLPQLPRGDYYTLYMTRKGERLVVCGTFNVRGGQRRTTVRLSGAYDVSAYDGLEIVEYKRAGHRERSLLRGSLA